MKFTKKSIELDAVINEVDFTDNRLRKIADAMTYIGIIATGVGFTLAIAGENLRRGVRDAFIAADNDGMYEIAEMYARSKSCYRNGFYGNIE